ncbi:MFS general substrate transporter [Melanomma pulvis-pyrius CBS 109.77]|uniref:MFS general substrate transporter n=1 Tax=Melanomma pulvis-pyrius CBS 109.77 TaxID=1314802 RepID=A0A6A6WQD8_9PLEO|nr:MFS general substrate transporter [Melanomma pulvis-pyrius CBS 109.77]
MAEIIREAPLGKLIRFVSGNRLLQYPEEQLDFQLPLQYTTLLSAEKPTLSQPSNTPTITEELDTNAISEERKSSDTDSDLEGMSMTRTKSRHYSEAYTAERFVLEQQLSLSRTKTIPIVPQKTSDGVILVDWYTTDDPANPQNWSSRKRAFIVFLICAYTWVVYTGSSIYAPSEQGVMQRFGVSPTAASLPLSLYVLGYGVGPLLFAPLCEIPGIGRNPVYIVTFIIFFALSFPTAVSQSFGGLLTLRFLQGFFGSPALANGGASFSDMYSLLYVPYQLSWWVFSAWGGPALGPLMAGFAVSAKNWRWSLWEIVWMAAPVLVILLLLMPETSTPNILLRRAQRLRKITGNMNLQSQSEIDQRHLTASGILVDALIKPIEITIKDPAIFFVNMYTALFYGIYYTFFEVFPLVFPPFYGFNLGETGLAFLSCQVGATIGLLGYFAYLYWYMIPDNIAHGLRGQEHRLVPAIFGSFLIPTGLFIFGWTARPDIHFIVPLIGVVIFVVGTFLILQSIFVWLPLTYPKYAASLFAGNDLTRSAMACGSILYARPLFLNVGIAEGVSVLAGISVAGIFGMLAIYQYGAILRARSKFAQN